MAEFPAGGRFHWADSHPTADAGTTYIQIPESGSVYSWPKFFRLNATVAPTGSLSNLRFFTDGTAWGTGVTPWAGTTGTYSQATAADQTAKRAAASTNATTLTSAAPLVVNAGTVLTATTGYGTQDYVIMQLEVASTASPGLTAARTLTYRVNET